MMPRDSVVLPAPRSPSRKIRPCPFVVWGDACTQFSHRRFISQVQGYFQTRCLLLQQLTNGWNQITGRQPTAEFTLLLTGIGMQPTARHAASNASMPWASNAPTKPASTSPNPAVAIAG